MKNILRNCMYQGRNLYRDKSFLFWTLLYPLIMAIFFYTAFNGMINMKLENVDMGIKEGNPIEFILAEIEFLNVHKISEDEISAKLESGEIEGFVDDNFNLLVKSSGINQTIMKEILDQIKQMRELRVPMEKFDFNVNYVSERNQKADSVIIIFYSLIAMVSAYGIFPGIVTVSLIQANLTNLGKRINSTPLKKNEFLLAGVIVSLILNLFSNILLLIFIKYILKIELFTEIGHSVALIIMGNLFGVALGIFIGASNKQNENTKTLLAIMITLVLSALSGMMSPNIKVLVDQKFPIVGRVNPISVITNNLYRINLLGSTKNVGEGIMVLSIYCIALISISYMFLRRKVYDSI